MIAVSALEERSLSPIVRAMLCLARANRAQCEVNDLRAALGHIEREIERRCAAAVRAQGAVQAAAARVAQAEAQRRRWLDGCDGRDGSDGRD